MGALALEEEMMLCGQTAVFVCSWKVYTCCFCLEPRQTGCQSLAVSSNGFCGLSSASVSETYVGLLLSLLVSLNAGTISSNIWVNRSGLLKY